MLFGSSQGEVTLWAEAGNVDVDSGNASQIYLVYFYTLPIQWPMAERWASRYAMRDYYMHDSFMFRRHSLLSGKQYAWLTLCITYRMRSRARQRVRWSRSTKSAALLPLTYVLRLHWLRDPTVNVIINHFFNNCIACFIRNIVAAQRLQLWRLAPTFMTIFDSVLQNGHQWDEVMKPAHKRQCWRQRIKVGFHFIIARQHAM